MLLLLSCYVQPVVGFGASWAKLSYPFEGRVSVSLGLFPATYCSTREAAATTTTTLTTTAQPGSSCKSKVVKQLLRLALVFCFIARQVFLCNNELLLSFPFFAFRAVVRFESSSMKFLVGRFVLKVCLCVGQWKASAKEKSDRCSTSIP